MAGTEILISLAISAGVSAITSALAPKQKLLPVDKGRFDDIRIQGSEYGGSVPILYGRARMSGNVIWSDGVQPHVTTTPGRSGGKGIGGGHPPEPPTNHYSYTTNIAIAICEGGGGSVAQGLKKIWENTKVTVNVDNSPVSGDIYEAESTLNTLTGTATIVRDLSASNEYKVLLNAGTLTINQIVIAATGDYDVKISYSALGDKLVNVKFDGGSYTPHTFLSTGGTSIYSYKTITVTLTAGTHTMTFAPVVPGFSPGLDCVGFQGQGIIVTPRGVTGIVDPDAQFPDPNHPGEFLPYPADPHDPTAYFNARLIPDDITGTATGGQYNPSAPDDPNILLEPIEPEPPGGGGGGGGGSGGGNSGGGGSSFGAFVFYSGSETQLPDSMMESIDGIGSVPAYRGTCYITFNNYQIPDGQMPNFSFEIDEGTHDLAAILISLWNRVGLDSAYLNVTALVGTFVEGLVINSRTPLTDILDTLSIAFAFDFVDLDGKVTAIKRGQSSVVTLTKNDLRAYEDGSELPVAVVEGSYVNIEELPKQMDVSYIDRAKDYHQNAQPALKQIGYTEEPQTLTLPIVLSATQAQEIGLRVLNTIHMQRATYAFTLPPKFAYLSPTDVITVVLPTVTYKLRITNFQTGIPGMCKVQAVVDSASLYTNIGVDDGSGAEIPPISFPANTELVLMDIQPLRPEDTGFGFYASGCARGIGDWFGSHLYKEDISVPDSWERIGGFEVPATQGITGSALDASPIYDPDGFDTTSILSVHMYFGTLESYTPEEILADTTLNLCYVGGEICQFTDAVVDNSTTYPYVRSYTITGFKRGLNGTTDKITTHDVAEKFVYFDNAVKFIRMPAAHLYLTANYKAVTIGQPLIGAEVVVFNSGQGSAPPVVTNLALTQIEGITPEGIAFVNIRGTFNFGEYVGGQKAKILLRRPGELVYTNSGIVVFPDANNQGAFELSTSGNGTYWIKVVSMSPFEHQQSEPPAVHPALSIVIASSNPVPATPTAPVPSFDGQILTWYWTQSIDPRHAYYQIADNSVTPVILPDGFRIDGNSYTEYPTTGLQRRIRSVSNQGTPSLWSPVGTFTIAAVPTPVWDSPAYDFDGQNVTWHWVASTANNFSHYKVYDGLTNLVLPAGVHVGSNHFTEYPVDGIQRKIVAVTTQLQQSPLSVAQTFTVPPPSVPTGYALTFDGYSIVHSWIEVPGLSYDIDDDKVNPLLATDVRGGQWLEITTPPTRSTTRYIRATRYGAHSAWSTGVTLSITAPVAPTSVVFDSGHATPYDVPLIVTTPGSLDRRYIRYTQIQILKASDLSVISTYLVDGIAETFLISGRFADPNTRTIHAKVGYVDFFGIGATTTTSTSYTFPALGGGGTGATATANLSGNTVGSVSITAGGSGYLNPPQVTFSGGGGTGAAGTATVSGGAVTAVSMTNNGTGYTSAPTVEFSGGGDIIDPYILGTNIHNGVLNTAAFASTIRPVTIYNLSTTVLPTLPVSTYPAGAYLYWVNAAVTTDRHLYRVNDLGTTWVAAVGANDIVANSITAGQIAVGAIGADQIAANAIRANHLAIGTLTDNLVLNSSFEDFAPISNFPTGWVVVEGSGTITSTSVKFIDGSYSLSLPSGTVAAGARAFAVNPGEKYSVRFKLLTLATGGVYYVRINELNTALPLGKNYIGLTTAGEVQARTSLTELRNTYNGANELLSGVNLTSLGSDTWVQKECVYTVPTGVRYVTFAVYNWTGSNNTLYVDAVDLRKQIQGVVIENGAITAVQIAAATITGDLIAGNTITANNLIIGGMSDNLLANPSFETLDGVTGGSESFGPSSGTGLPISWTAFVADGWGSHDNGVPGSSKSAFVNQECGVSSRIIPVVPGSRIAVRALARTASYTESFVIVAMFREIMPTSGTELQLHYIGSSALGASAYESIMYFSRSNNDPTYSTQAINLTTSFLPYEGVLVVPAGKYWMSLGFVNDEFSIIYVDDVSVRSQTGSAFISDLRADQIVANTGDFGLIFSDQIRQKGSVTYQLGSTHTLGTNVWTFSNGNISYQATGDLTIYTGTASNWDTATFSQAFQIIEASSATIKKDGYFEFTYSSKTSGSYCIGGLVPSTLTVGTSNHAKFEYSWYLDTSGVAYCYEAAATRFTAAGTYKEGDVFRVSVENGYVRYRKNGTLIWTSPYTVASTRSGYVYPAFKGGLAFYGIAQLIVKSVALIQSGIGQGWRLNPLTGISFTSQEPIWPGAYLVGNVPSDPNAGITIIKNGGSSGWDTSLASDQTIASGDGWVQASLNNYTGTHNLMFGLANANFTNPNYTTLNFAVYFSNTTIQVYESGTLKYTLTGGHGQGDVFRVAIEGAYVKYRKNGAVFYTSATTVFTYPYRMKICLYLPNDGIANPLMNASASGAGEFNSGITVKGKSLDETVALATDALRSDRRYRGNDRTSPSTQITNVLHTSYKIDFEDDVVTVALSMNVNDFKTNSTKQLDSSKHVRIRVFNKFNQRVNDIYGTALESYVAWHGRGVIFVGTFPRAYADPLQECVYSIVIENLYGLSDTLYYCEGAWKSAGTRTWTPLDTGVRANISYSPPQYMLASTCPTNCQAKYITTTSVRITWTPASGGPTGAHTVSYRIFKPQGYLAGSDGWSDWTDSTTGTADVTGLVADTRYEFMIRAEDDFGYYSWSNIAYCRTPAFPPPAPTYGVPLNLAGSSVAGGGTNNRTNNLTYTQNSSGGTFYDTRIYYATGATAIPTTASSFVTASGGTYAHTGRTDGVWYAYRALNRYNIGGTNVSELSSTVYVQAYSPAPPATVPSNLYIDTETPHSLTGHWTLNGGSTSTDVQLDYDYGNFSSPLQSATIGSSGTSKLFSGLVSDTGYQFRAKHSSDSIWAAPAYGTTSYANECIDYYTVMIAVDEFDKEYSLFAKNVIEGMRLVGISLSSGERIVGAVKKVWTATTSVRYTVIVDGCVLVCSPTHPLINGYGDIYGTAVQHLSIGDPVVMYNEESGSSYVAPIENITIDNIETPVVFFTLDSKDHTFVSNRILSHNTKNEG